MTKDKKSFFKEWFVAVPTNQDVVHVLKERADKRDKVHDALVECATDHVIGLNVITRLGGFPKASHILKNRIPAAKIARSGMLGEILATEYVDQQTDFTVPIRRLRYRDTRDLAMRGDDVLGFKRTRTTVSAIKVEAKSRAKLTTAVIDEARLGLANHRGRPNPETLAFLECILRNEGKDIEAEPIAELQQQTIKAKQLTHLLFTLSGNNPQNFLELNSQAIVNGIELKLCGCHISDHSDFVKQLFDACLAKG